MKKKQKNPYNQSRRELYEYLFLNNRFPLGQKGKVVYIRPEFHERLLRIVQLTKKEKITLYSYLDNVLDLHFKEYGLDITDFHNQRYKPIL